MFGGGIESEGEEAKGAKDEARTETHEEFETSPKGGGALFHIETKKSPKKRIACFAIFHSLISQLIGTHSLQCQVHLDDNQEKSQDGGCLPHWVFWGSTGVPKQ